MHVPPQGPLGACCPCRSKFPPFVFERIPVPTPPRQTSAAEKSSEAIECPGGVCAHVARCLISVGAGVWSAC
jgi:hypothetical protein